MPTLRGCSPPPGLFKGQNFMTRDIIAYYEVKDGYAELSSGRGMTGNAIFGVTVRPEEPGCRRSKLCHSRLEALEYIESLTIN